MRPLHHIALGAADVEVVAEFYRAAFSLPEVDRHFDDDDKLRSIWLGLGEAVLMIEHTEAQRPEVIGVGAGPFLLAFTIEKGERAKMEARLQTLGACIEARSDYTSYVRDPEGNRVGISHYPT